MIDAIISTSPVWCEGNSNHRRIFILERRSTWHTANSTVHSLHHSAFPVEHTFLPPASLATATSITTLWRAIHGPTVAKATRPLSLLFDRRARALTQLGEIEQSTTFKYKQTLWFDLTRWFVCLETVWSSSGFDRCDHTLYADSSKSWKPFWKAAWGNIHGESNVFT